MKASKVRGDGRWNRGRATEVMVVQVKLIDIEWKNCAEYDGGEVGRRGKSCCEGWLIDAQVILLDEVQALVNGEVSDKSLMRRGLEMAAADGCLERRQQVRNSAEAFFLIMSYSLLLTTMHERPVMAPCCHRRLLPCDHLVPFLFFFIC
eukprot:754898-Hanusia_phi.AAC.11